MNNHTEINKELNVIIAKKLWENSVYYDIEYQKVNYPSLTKIQYGTSPIDNTPFYCFLYTKYEDGELYLFSTLDEERAKKQVCYAKEAMNPVLLNSYIKKTENGKTLKRYGISEYGEDTTRDTVSLCTYTRITEYGVKSTGDVLYTNSEVIAEDIPYPEYWINDKYPYTTEQIASKNIPSTKRQRRKHVLQWLISLGINPKVVLRVANFYDVPLEETGLSLSTSFSYTGYYLTDGLMTYLEEVSGLDGNWLYIVLDRHTATFYVRLIGHRKDLPNI